MLRRLKIKFVSIFMITVTVMLSVIFATVISMTHRNAEHRSIAEMKDIAAPPIHHEIPEKTKNDHPPMPHFTLSVSSDGEVVAESDGMFDLSDEKYLNTLYEYVESCEEESGIIPETSLRYFRNESSEGKSYIFTDVSTEADMIEGLYRTCAVIGAIAFLLFFVISIFLANWAVRPVEDAWNKQKQFIADASHELKTPLTVITTNAELMKTEDIDKNQNRFTDNILAMTKQMRGLVESMLEIARLDNGGIKKPFSVFELSETVSDSVLPFEALFFEKEQNFNCEIEDGIKINGNPEQIKQVIDILLDNANKYAPAKSDIKLTLKKQGRNQCRILVSDNGEAIPEEDLKNIFKRFYRGDKTRQMNNSYGLGLSIAESIINEHSGKIFAESKNGINTFTVQLHTI